MSCPSLCPFPTLLQPHWPSLSFLSQALSCLWAFNMHYSSAWNILPSFYLKFREASCYPYTKVYSFGLGLYHVHLLAFFTACFHYFISLLTCSFVFALCDWCLPHSFYALWVERSFFFLSITVSLNLHQKLDKYSFNECMNEWMSELF